jgi:hypothetical protein
MRRLTTRLQERLEAAAAFSLPTAWYGGLLLLLATAAPATELPVALSDAPERTVWLQPAVTPDAAPESTAPQRAEIERAEPEAQATEASAPAEPPEADSVTSPAERREAASDLAIAIPAASAPAAQAASEHFVRPERELSEAARELAASRAARRPQGRTCAETHEGVVAVSETEFRVDRATVDAYAGDLERASQLAWVGWSRDASGEIQGFVVRRMGCSSILRYAGLRNGDVIHTINGQRITTVSQALKAYVQLRDKRVLRLQVTRSDGTSLQLKYRLV